MIKSRPWAERKDACKRTVRRALDNNDMEALAESLPPLQKQFCEEYIKDFNGSQAVQRTDSTTEYPEKVAYIWMNNPGVKAYIKYLTEARTEQLKIDQGFVIQKLLSALDKAERTNNQQVAVRTIELLAKHLGMLTDKQEITGKDGGAIQYEKMTQDAESFTRAIASLANRAGKGGLSPKPIGRGESDSEVELEVLGSP